MLEGVGVLLIEDDDGDALLVADLLEDGAVEVRLTRARSLHQALAELTGEVDCILLDLGLPTPSASRASDAFAPPPPTSPWSS